MLMNPVTQSVCIVSHNAYGAVSGGSSGFIGGVEWQTSLTARWFVQRGYSVSLLTWDEGGPVEEMKAGIRIIKICKQKAGLPGLRFFHPKWTGLIKAMRKADADVYYHNCGECVTGQIAFWCRNNQRRFVFSAASDADCNPALPELVTRRERVFYRYGLKRASQVIVQTLTQQRHLREHFGVGSVVIPMPCPGCPDAEFTVPSPDTRRVVWIGRVCQVKRPDRYLDLAETTPEISFDLVGPFYGDAHGKETQARAPRIQNLTVHGAVPRSGIPEFYRRAALLCCTSEYEGFPNTFLEAWSHGLPIVSTVDPDGVISKRNLGVVVKDVAEMRQAIRGLLATPDRYREIAMNARNYYTENHTMEAVLPRFETVLFDRPRPRNQGIGVRAGLPKQEA
jgi:glycosyltransferase involved in cell wall biosynthesis